MDKFNKNSLISIADQILTGILAFLITWLVALHFDAEGIGIYSYSMAVAGVLSLLSNLGIQIYIKRKISLSFEDAGKLLGQGLYIRIFFSFPLLFTFLCLYFLSPVGQLENFYYILGASIYTFFTGIFTMTISAYYAILNVRPILIINIFSKLMVLIVLSVKFFIDYSLISYIWLITLISFISAMIAINVYRNLTQELRFFRQDFRSSIGVILLSMPLVMAAMIEFLILKIDLLILGSLVSKSEVGNYSISTSIIIAYSLISLAFYKVLATNITRGYSKNGYKGSAAAVKPYLKYLFLYGIFGFAFFYFFLPKVIIFILGNSFSAASEVVKIFAILAPIIIFSRLSGYYLISTFQEKVFLNINIFALIINIIFNFYLIPIYGISGAAIASIFSEIIILMSSFYIISRGIKNE